MPPQSAFQLETILSQHSTDIAVLKSTNEFVREDIADIKCCVSKIDEKIDGVVISLEAYKTENAKEDIALARETTGLQTKYSLLWYIMGTLVIGGLVGKFILPLIGL